MNITALPFSGIRGATSSSPFCGRRRRSRDGHAATSTPPKTPKKSPRTKSPLPNNDGVKTSNHLPYAVCEAVTNAVWAHAKSQALQAVPPSSDASAPLEHTTVEESKHRQLQHASSSESVDSSKAPSPPAKRQRSQAGEHRDEPEYICPTFGTSQPSQTQFTPDSQFSLAADAAVQHAFSALRSSFTQAGGCEAMLTADILGRVRAMALDAVAYWQEVSTDLGKASSSLARFLDSQRRLYWRHSPWHGVNLGGWLLLEPGSSAQLFEHHAPDKHCEWDLMHEMKRKLGDEGAIAALRAHRDSFITEEDIKRIKALGFNAVRIPFGYWVITGPDENDAYMGPCIEYLDRAVSWCRSHGLQALLDLHGAPGGESGEKPCGRERGDWRWQDWRVHDSIEVLKSVAQRYAGNPAVTGISVCNEPSETVPADVLCDFYYQAVRVIRDAGMPPDEVAIVLPVFRTERLDEIWRIWNKDYDGFARYPNVAFDLHLYHVFGAWWQRQGLGSHMRMTRRHRKILRRVPAVVGEWSLCLPPQVLGEDSPQEEDQAIRNFAAAQLDAYSQASHGWFFWNWRDSPKQHAGWDLNKCVERRWLTKSQLVVSATVANYGGS